MMEAKALLTSPRYSLYLFYWYKSTNTDAAHSLFLLGICRSKHAVFTPAAERQELQGKREYKRTNTDAFIRTRVQILTHSAVQKFRVRAVSAIGTSAWSVIKGFSRCTLSLLYQYKSTNTDT